MKNMNKASKTALGGMTTALIVIMLLPTMFRSMIYVLPAFAGIIIMLCVVELGRAWAAGIYVSSSLISLLVVPNKEAVVIYIAFFGYYAIVKSILESKRLPRVVEYIIKFAIFNVAVILASIFLMKVLGMPYEQVMGIEGKSGFIVKYAIPITLVAGNISFFALDIFMTSAVTLYLRVWQKKFRKLFRFK